ncbi:ubiquitin carboxyl-terminal hydrolase 14 [Cantharellus anzutake]|uniref:ubiquitin carboxyl-terminal hydrolase 14 n=1 Tax=Cantharellus anzutake TaxID=1750568 RepID=UPI0019058282|nr:ubiquitin carboxyl-terminal hydrolase 14 [Cantharellus anzutake]KAF8327578.1 ubiquitin carboxyl-terminal hydrolase 14 [Cantharellus anzutake]
MSWIKAIVPLSSPRLSQAVHREECTQCFDSQDGQGGVDVCLTCFNGGCVDQKRRHATIHAKKFGHPLSLNIQRHAKPRRDDQEPPLKRIAILEEREEDKYTWSTTLRSWIDDTENGVLIPEASENIKVKSLIDGIMSSMSSARQSEVKAWEEEIVASHCLLCELTENLWLCLTCGSLGCGRQQFGGLGGHGHGLKHWEETSHPVAVKLGTITAEGNADIYCYACNDSKLDPEIALHLSAFGINIQSQVKTEKTITELQIEQNLKFDFSMTGEDGKFFEPLFGPGLTGLSNLGNSCYMASTVQTLFSLPSFRSRYYITSDSSTLDSAAQQHFQNCAYDSPADCLECQLYKLADGLLSGRYSHPRKSPSSALPAQISEAPIPNSDASIPAGALQPVFQEGIKPAMFKALIGKGHSEFSTMRQQDSEEFLTHLIKVLRQGYKKRGHAQDPTEVFNYGMEQRLQCGDCKRVSYRVDEHDVVSVAVPAREKKAVGEEAANVQYEDVLFEECLNLLTATEALEWRCPACSKNVIANKKSSFATFPQVLVVHAKKFQLVNWVPQKLAIPVQLPSSGNITLDKYLGHGIQPGEEPLPKGEQKAYRSSHRKYASTEPPPMHAESSSGATTNQPTYNEGALSMLESMGFPLIRCQKALLATGNQDGEAAMEWLFAHMDDPDIDDPIPVQSSGGGASGPEPAPESIALIADMGFTEKQARKALRETGGSTERAIDWLFSHPDDTGEDSTPLGGADVTSSTKNVPGGTVDLPANYRLKAFISHKGPSVHSGHYVAHIREPGLGAADGDSWVLFNDEKVVKADEESVKSLMPLAYLYFFERL